jgi:hypothetical protein
MIYSAGDLGVEVDLGANASGAVLQRKEPDGWRDYLPAGDQVCSPVDVHVLLKALPAGYYRLVADPGAAGGA